MEWNGMEWNVMYVCMYECCVCMYVCMYIIVPVLIQANASKAHSSSARPVSSLRLSRHRWILWMVAKSCTTVRTVETLSSNGMNHLSQLVIRISRCHPRRMGEICWGDQLCTMQWTDWPSMQSPSISGLSFFHELMMICQKNGGLM